MANVVSRSADVATGDRLWEVPYQRNEHFSGRETYLTELRKRFNADSPVGKHQVLYGLGGIGKSQIALEYAYRFKEHYTLVWWLPAEDPTALGLAFARLARAIGLKFGPEVSLDDVRHRSRRVLGQLSDWLIIFDNAIRPADIQNYLPIQRSGHVLITSQTQDWGDLAYGVPVRPMERRESVEFLHKRVHQQDPNDLASKLAQTLGDLPLALEQAAAVMEETGASYSAYLRRFETHWAELLQRSAASSADHPDSLGMTLELSFRQVEEDSPPSAALLYFASFLSSEYVPRSFIQSSVELLPPPLSAGVMVDLDKTVEPLARYSLVDSNAEAIAVHRLVSALTRRRLTADEQSKWCIAASKAVAAMYRYNSDEPSTWPTFAEGLPHVLSTAQHAQQLGVVPDVVADLLSNAGRYLLKQGRLTEARGVLERAIDVTRRVYGNNHPRTSDAANNLGRVLQRLGDLPAASENFGLSLQIDQKVYGQNDPRVATVANNYGMCLLASKDYAAAQHHFQWALSVYESHYGPEHPKIASVLNNLGCALRDSGHTDSAREVFSRGLSIAESSYSPDHPTTASLLYNLGQLLRGAGEHAGAESYFRRALTIDENAFGPTHPDVARDLIGLSRAMMEQGYREESEKFADRARKILAESNHQD
jgi:Tfp pilus assembly protein PilF